MSKGHCGRWIASWCQYRCQLGIENRPKWLKTAEAKNGSKALIREEKPSSLLRFSLIVRLTFNQRVGV